MSRARWRNRFGPPILLMTALFSTFVTPAALSAGLSPAAPVAIDCRNVTSVSVARAVLNGSSGRAAVARIQPQIAKRGELTGRVLSAQTAAGSAISIALPVESFVGPAVGDLVLYTRHSAETGSEVRAVSLVSGCDVRLAAPGEIVRSAVLDPLASSVYVHSVSRSGRADAGVARYDLATGKAVQALAPVRTPDRFGLIFGTELRWDMAGDRLAVQSCGFSRCLTRVLDVASGQVSTFDSVRQGAFIGLTETHLITFAGCHGLPCDVLSTDLATGSVSSLATEAFSAQLEASGAGTAALSIETSAGVVEVIQ